MRFKTAQDDPRAGIATALRELRAGPSRFWRLPGSRGSARAGTPSVRWADRVRSARAPRRAFRIGKVVTTADPEPFRVAAGTAWNIIVADAPALVEKLIAKLERLWVSFNARHA